MNKLDYAKMRSTEEEFIKDLKPAYQAVYKDLAELELEKKWGDKYPIIISSWRNKGENPSNYFKYPSEILKIIYSSFTPN